jgi:hypothetical protein
MGKAIDFINRNIPHRFASATKQNGQVGMRKKEISINQSSTRALCMVEWRSNRGPALRLFGSAPRRLP